MWLIGYLVVHVFNQNYPAYVFAMLRSLGSVTREFKLLLNNVQRLQSCSIIEHEVHKLIHLRLVEVFVQKKNIIFYAKIT